MKITISNLYIAVYVAMALSHLFGYRDMQQTILGLVSLSAGGIYEILKYIDTKNDKSNS